MLAQKSTNLPKRGDILSFKQESQKLTFGIEFVHKIKYSCMGWGEKGKGKVYCLLGNSYLLKCFSKYDLKATCLRNTCRCPGLTPGQVMQSLEIKFGNLYFFTNAQVTLLCTKDGEAWIGRVQKSQLLPSPIPSTHISQSSVFQTTVTTSIF